jgi:DNA repair exonuclease SbcCD ATPase subunit
MNTLAVYERLTHESSGKKQMLGDLLEKQLALSTSLKISQQSLELAQAFIQKVAKETQEQLKYQIADIVNMALDTCFPGEYTFDVDFQIKRGKTEASLVFIKDGHSVDPMDASGGGVVDLASFALRIAVWCLGKTDNVIVLDEPFRFLSRDLQPQAGEILREISHRLNLQIIMVTHSKDIISASDRVFEVVQINNVSKISVRQEA